MGSTRPNPPGVTEIFSEYVRQRKSGRSQQQVVDFLKPLLSRLRQDARRQLIALLRSWEAREGSKHAPTARSQDAANDAAHLVAPPQPGENLAWLRELEQEQDKNKSQPTPNPARFNSEAPAHPSVMFEEPVKIPQGDTVYCSACGRANRKQDVYCYACGEVLVTATVETRNLDPGTADLQHVSKTYFGQSSALLLHVRNHDRPILVRIQDRSSVVLGRSSQKTGALPDIDLEPFSAAESGVSRQHARLKFQDNTITIMDLGSVNHTYLNGQRLHPHEVRVLRDGDELRLGRLLLRVAFQHMVGRLK